MEISLTLNNELVFDKIITKKDVFKAGIRVTSLTLTILALTTSIPVLASPKDVGSFFAPINDMNSIDRLFEIYCPIDFKTAMYILGLSGECAKNEIAKALGVNFIEVVRFFQ